MEPPSPPPGSTRNIARVQKTVAEKLPWVEFGLQRVIEASPLWRRKLRLPTSTPGIAATTVVAMPAGSPDLGTLTRRQAEARCALYMPTLAAIRYNARIRTLYQRLVANGRPEMTAVVTCMRKLAIALNALIRDDNPWRTPQCT